MPPVLSGMRGHLNLVKGKASLAQLVMAHLIVDYPAQTDWIFAKKHQGWTGLLQHGGIALVTQGAALSPHTLQLLLLILNLGIVHTLQDWLKLHVEKWIPGPHPLKPIADQALHIVLLALAASRMGGLAGPSDSVCAVRHAGCDPLCAPHMDLLRHMAHTQSKPQSQLNITWLWIGKLELALALTAGLPHVWWLTPLTVIPRPMASRQREGNLCRNSWVLWLDAAQRLC